MLPFSSSLDVIFAALTVLALVGLAVAVFALARHQRPRAHRLPPREAVGPARVERPEPVGAAAHR